MFSIENVFVIILLILFRHFSVSIYLKELYVRLWPKLVLQSLSNYCRVVNPLPHDSRLPDRLQDPTFFYSTHLYLLLGELEQSWQPECYNTTDFVIGRSVEGGASDQNGP